jgi:hypothetical protein
MVQPGAVIHGLQFPCTHSSSLGHGLSQPPQFSGSVSVLTHALLHSVVLPVHWDTHIPFWQKGVFPPHGIPIPPQFWGSVMGSMQAPLTRMSPGLQTHWPPPQISVSPHWLPHEPQSLGSIIVSTQLLPHAVKPPVQPHTPLVHTPKTGSQLFPQPPQWSTSVDTSTHWPPQAIRPGGQTHTPDVQVALVGHWLSHMPQFWVSEERSAQPIAGPQSTLPGGQMHAPETHVPLPQEVPHAPQLFVSVLRSAHTPSFTQATVFGGQGVHIPETHIWPMRHGLSHAPQLFMSEDRSAQPFGQATSPGLQVHAPAMQLAPGGQSFPHMPQWPSSVCVSTQVLPHSVGAAGGHEQTPETQEPLMAQSFPHMPQWSGSAERSAQTPCGVHATVPGPHSHRPAVQIAPGGQAVAQSPQCALSVCVSTQSAPHTVMGALQAPPVPALMPPAPVPPAPPPAPVAVDAVPPVEIAFSSPLHPAQAINPSAAPSTSKPLKFTMTTSIIKRMHSRAGRLRHPADKEPP